MDDASFIFINSWLSSWDGGDDPVMRFKFNLHKLLNLHHSLSLMHKYTHHSIISIYSSAFITPQLQI